MHDRGLPEHYKLSKGIAHTHVIKTSNGGDWKEVE